MIHMKVRDILTWIQGELVQGLINAKINHVTVDPKDVKRNTLFFAQSKAIKWRSFPFKEMPVIVTDNPFPILKVTKKVTIIYVQDIETAYWRFVSYYRSLFDIPVFGITGTCGKTTTTEMIKHILSPYYRVHGTDDGKNNLSNNLPYLLGMDYRTEAAVFEMGVSHPGCIEYSCRHLQPKIGILLNIGVYHLQGCKTFEKYLQAKAELLQGITPGGTLILNSDDENIAKIDVSKFNGQIVTFGLRQADYRARDVRMIHKGMSFTLETNNQRYPLFVHGYGVHNVYNALAALAAVHVAGMDIVEAGKWLSTFKQIRQHLEFKKGRKGCIVIDDTWNCTPPSMTAALKVLRETGVGRRKVAVLGHMPQLGEAKEEYDKMAVKVLEAGVHQLIVLGEAQRIGRQALKLGMDSRQISYCDSGVDVYHALRPKLSKQDLVLFKFPYKYRLSKKTSFRNLMDWMLGKGGVL